MDTSGQQDVSWHYDRLAETFDEHWAYSPEFTEWMLAQLSGRLAPAEGEHGMDLGCGTGLYSRVFAPTGTPVTLVEPSLAMIARAMQPAGADIMRLLPVSATAEEIAYGREDLPYRAYEAILAKEVLHHVGQEERASVVHGLAGLLAPGGRLVVAMLPARIDYPLWPEALEAFAAQQPDPAAIADEMHTAGLEADVEYAGFPVRFSLERWTQMLRARYMSLLSAFSDTELERGIAAVRHAHDGVVAFEDRWAFVTGRRPAGAV